MNIEYKNLSSIEGYWGDTTLGIKIMVGGDLPEGMDQDSINRLTYTFIEKLKDEILAQKIKEDPKSSVIAAAEKKGLIDLFPDHIFVEEIPNGYGNMYYLRHLPWFIVTTKLGRIKIGWRKRVIEIDWSDSIIKHDARELFPDENVTKGEKYIHAWSLEKAKEYIEALGIKN